MPPGPTCARSAIAGLIITARGSAELKRRPARTLTRSIAVPSPPNGLPSATMPEKGEAPGTGRDICGNIVASSDDTPGSRATARK